MSSDTLNKCYNLIKTNGEPLKKAHPSMGGIWHADIWVLGKYQARLTDDGWSRSIHEGQTCAYQTGDHPVNFYDGGSDEWLSLVYVDLCLLTS